MQDFAPALPHGPLQQLFDDVFVVRSSFDVGPLMRIARNMVVVRRGSDLTLINSARLSPEGEAELAKLGTVRNLVKLGYFHTRDDAYMRHRYQPQYWSVVEGDSETKVLQDGGASPIEGAKVFGFRGAQRPEAALVLEQPGGNLLITCDSVQNWQDTQGCSLVGGLALRAMGFFTPAKIGPIWLKESTGGQIQKLRPEFDRLLDRDFAHLIAGHGVLLRDQAHQALKTSHRRTFGA